MNSAKERAHSIIDQLPDDCTVDDILYRLYASAKIERGLEDVRQGNVVTQEEITKEMREWESRFRGQPKPVKTS